MMPSGPAGTGLHRLHAAQKDSNTPILPHSITKGFPTGWE